MAKYIVTNNFKTPLALNGNNPRSPMSVKYIPFRKGQVIEGVLKTNAEGKPNFILHKGRIVIPIEAVKELVTKAVISSNASGSEVKEPEVSKKVVIEGTKKITYIDAAIIGGILGAAVVWFIEKKGWVTENPENKIPHQNKLMGIGLGALAGAYFVYRKKIKDSAKIIKETAETQNT